MPYQKKLPPFNKDKLLRIYKVMYSSRLLDDIEIRLAKTPREGNKTLFQISSSGHEALGVALALAALPRDWLFPYYRDRALLLARGYPPLAILLDSLGKEHNLNSHGRQMPSHWHHQRVFPCASPTGCQFLPAAGCAEATLFYEKFPNAESRKNYTPGEITVVTGGDGFYCQGEFWEALNVACLKKLPLIFVVEDNGYAISVSSQEHTPGRNVAANLRSMANLEVYEADGLDPLNSYEALSSAVERARNREGPSLVHAQVIRPYSHSSNDSAAKYRAPEEIINELLRDPVVSRPESYPLPKEVRAEAARRGVKYGKFAESLVRDGIATEEEIVALRREVEKEIRAAEEEALKTPLPNAGKATLHLYSSAVDPTSTAFQSPVKFGEFNGASKPSPTGGESVTMAEALTRTLETEMKRNEKILVFGEDVADGPAEALEAGAEGKGGVFGITKGLQKKYGERVFNTPLAEAAIVGRAVGLASRGWKPVAEIQFMDYIWPAENQIRQQLATLRWRSFGAWSCPAVIRVCVGSPYGGGTAIWHSQCFESVLAHIPGVYVVFPSSAEDAAGLLRTALRADDPVFFLEHKGLYRNPRAKTSYPADDYTLPLGSARIIREGKDATIVTYGAAVYLALDAAENLARDGISVEVIDLRTLKPWDREIVTGSFRKTNNLLVLHEDIEFAGFGAEVLATLAERCTDDIDRIARLGAKDCWVPYAPSLEREILPQTDEIEKKIKDMLK